MAISESRSITKSVASLFNKDFLKSDDRSLDSESNITKSVLNKVKSKTNKAAIKAGKTSITENVRSDTTSLANSRLAILNDSTKCDINQNRNNLNKDDRDFNKLSKTTDCSGTAVTTNVSRIQRQLDRLPDKNIANLEKVISIEQRALAKTIGSTNINTDTVKTVRGITDRLGVIGGSLKEKLSFTGVNLFCTKTLSSYTAGDNTSVTGTLLQSSISDASCVKPENLIKFITTITDNPNVSKKDVVKGLVNTLRNSEDVKVFQKTLILNSFIKTSPNELSDKTKVLTKGKSGQILKSISELKRTTNSPVSDYNTLTDTLSTLDTRWNTDVNGVMDYSSVSDNKFMSGIAYSSINSTPSTNTVLGSSPTNTPERLAQLHILANNKYNVDLKSRNITGSKNERRLITA